MIALDKDRAIGGNLLLLRLLGELMEILCGQLDRLVTRNDDDIIFFAPIYPLLNSTHSRRFEYHSWDQVSSVVIFSRDKGLLYSRMIQMVSGGIIFLWFYIYHTNGV